MHIDKRKNYIAIVLKTAERCNINCTYCYFFNQNDDSFRKHSPLISLSTIQNVAKFLRQGCLDLNLDKITIAFHGGEPLLQKKSDFDDMCNIFLHSLPQQVEIDYALQTNAMLIDEEWVKLFHKYKIGVGVSIDGPKEFHDKYRLDHKGRGTFDKVVEKTKFLIKNPLIKELGGIGILSVLTHEYCPRKIYRFFVDELNAKTIDFLLPDFTHENKLVCSADIYGELLCQLFDEWISDDDPSIKVRILNSLMNILTGKLSLRHGFGPIPDEYFMQITISSDGELSPFDELRVCNKGNYMYNQSNIYNITLKEYLSSNHIQNIISAEKRLPDKCNLCCWQHICGGGWLVNRYGNNNEFNNPSVFCSSLKIIYAHIFSYLLQNGFSSKKALSVLNLKNEAFLH